MNQHIRCNVNGVERLFVLNARMPIVEFHNALVRKMGEPVEITHLQFLHQPSDLPAVAELITIPTES